MVFGKREKEEGVSGSRCQVFGTKTYRTLEQMRTTSTPMSEYENTVETRFYGSRFYV